MRRTILYFYLLCPFLIFAQGTNNPYEYDKEDFDLILKELGVSIFKFPVQQSSSNLYDVVVEEYEKNKLISTQSLFTITKESFASIDLDPTGYSKMEKDSIYWARFFIKVEDTAVVIRPKMHGVSGNMSFDFSGKSNYSLRALFTVKEQIDSLGHVAVNQEAPLLFLYANNKTADEQTLFCPAGIPKKQLIKRFHYVLFVSLVELPMEEKDD
ncbi:MAG: hypothetical protein AAGI38_21185 [Bacteroidota bacterium]